MKTFSEIAHPKIMQMILSLQRLTMYLDHGMKKKLVFMHLTVISMLGLYTSPRWSGKILVRLDVVFQETMLYVATLQREILAVNLAIM